MTTSSANSPVATGPATAAIDWFEIPVRDLDRARAFYETLLAVPLRREQMGANTLMLFGPADASVGGCLIAGPDVAAPSETGTLVYLNAEPSLDAALQRLAKAGGRVVVGKTQLPGDMGCFAHVADSEGNRVGLHAQH
jgi:predicted enzyme related to lactoylglutathione lyase